MVDVGGAIGLLHITQISGTRVDAVSEVFSVGEQLQALVVGIDPASGRLSLSTRALEATRGDMLTNRQAVVEGAAEMAAQWRAQREAQQAESTDAGQRAQGRDVNTALASVKVSRWLLAGHSNAAPGDKYRVWC
jgi:predicted RNA-binding protein with RPS1 domain